MANYTGTSGDDTFEGTVGTDTANGQGGNDTLRGNAGNDTLIGGAGADKLEGGANDDRLYSFASPGAWNDGYFYLDVVQPVLDKGIEADTLRGGDGDDIISAGYGDTVDGGSGIDKLLISFMGATSGIEADFTKASGTQQIIVGGAVISSIEQFDWIQATNHADKIWGADGIVFGMAGDDHLIATYHTARIYGGDGNDTIDATASGYGYPVFGDAGDDTIIGVRSADGDSHGGAGNDRFLASSGNLWGNAGNDRFELIASTRGSYVLGGSGSDAVLGSGSNERIVGNGGKDVLRGGSGGDFLFSGGVETSDLYNMNALYMTEYVNSAGYQLTLDNSAERDELYGDNGNDLLSIGYGDVADGGVGTDSLVLSLAGATAGVTLSSASLLGAGPFGFGGGTVSNIEFVALLQGSAHDDVLTLASQANRAIAYGGAGNDTIVSDGTWTLRGEAGDDHLVSGATADELNGGDGDDWLEAGAGNDTLIAGFGADRLDGQDGNDVFAFAQGELGAGDTIIGGAGIDRLVVTEGLDLSLASISGVETLTGSYVSGVFMTAAQVSGFAKIEIGTVRLTTGGTIKLEGGGGPELYVLADIDTAIDISGITAATAVHVYGGTGDDTFTGTSRADIFMGGSGDDRFRYSGGSDGYSGMDGIDTIDFRKAGAGVTVVLDTPWTDGSSSTGGSFSGIENVDGSVFDDVVTGNGDANQLLGFDGSDRLSGEQGEDLIDGGAGADEMLGGWGNDRFIVDNARDSVIEGNQEGNDSVEASVSYVLTAGSFIETLRLTGSAVGGTGNELANRIVGNAAANLLNGGGGADVLEGGTGNDRYIVDKPGAQVLEDAGAGTDRVEASLSWTLENHVENLILTGNAVINGTGNSLDNMIVGNSQGNVVDGGTGADLMEGRDGNDRYVIDNIGDKILETATGGSADIADAWISFSLAGQYVETLRLMGFDDINGSGNNQANTIYGNAGANKISAGGGDDKLYGGGGNDALTGGGGFDRFIFDTALHAATNVDKILDFNVADDGIYLSRTVFGSVASGTLSATAFVNGTAALDAGDRILYDKASGNIFYDTDGTGAGSAVLFASVTAGMVLTNADFIGF